MLALVSEFNCFLRSRCSMEKWCPDDTGRASWDWVGPPACKRACFNSRVWRGGSSPVKAEPPQIVLFVVVVLLLLVVFLLLFLLCSCCVLVVFLLLSWLLLWWWLWWWFWWWWWWWWWWLWWWLWWWWWCRLRVARACLSMHAHNAAN